MQINIGIDGREKGSVIAAQLRTLAASFETYEGWTGGNTEVEETTTTIRGRKVAKPASVKAAAADEEETEEYEASSDDEENFSVDEEETEEETGWTLTQVIDAFKKYAKNNSREKAAKVLAKYKAKSVRDLKETDYDSVMKTLSK